MIITDKDRILFMNRGIYEFKRIEIDDMMFGCCCGKCNGVGIYEYSTESMKDERVIFEDTFELAINSAINLLEKRGIKWKF